MSLMSAPTPLVLASGSAVRARLLADAGVTFERLPSRVDEAALKREIEEGGKPAADPDHGNGPEIARMLARAKACDVSRARPGAVVIGADQVMTLDGRSFDKPRSMEEARARLRAFRGRTHALHAGVALARDGEVIWDLCDTARLTMRDFSDAFLDAYLEAAGPEILSSVGAYQLEKLGAQLFSRIEGDFFSILGLPLLPLFDELRRLGILRA